VYGLLNQVFEYQTLHYERLQRAENRVYEMTPPIPGLEPAAPTIRLRFFGFASKPTGPRKAFLGKIGPEDDSAAAWGSLENHRRSA
jgi:hypothetical protein